MTHTRTECNQKIISGVKMRIDVFSYYPSSNQIVDSVGYIQIESESRSNPILHPSGQPKSLFNQCLPQSSKFRILAKYQNLSDSWWLHLTHERLNANIDNIIANHNNSSSFTHILCSANQHQPGVPYNPEMKNLMNKRICKTSPPPQTIGSQFTSTNRHSMAWVGTRSLPKQ